MSLRVLVVDNGGQWTHREWRVLKYLGVDTKKEDLTPSGRPHPVLPSGSPLEELT